MKFVKGAPAIFNALEQGRKILKNAKIRQIDLEAELLLSAAINKPREFIYTHPEFVLSLSEKRNFANFIKRRAKRIPLAYISGFKEFYGLAFFVNKNVLIPRPETEGLIDFALEEIKTIQKAGIKNIDIIDVGTGSGAIIVSLAKTTNQTRSPMQDTRFKTQDLKFYGLDSSKRALAIAQENAKRLGVSRDIQFLRGHLLRPYFQITKRFRIQDSGFKLIVANLPYLTTSEMKNLQPEVRYEPRQALDGGIDGLNIYRVFFKQLTKLQNSRFTAVCEIAPGQKIKFLKITKEALPRSETKFIKDLFGRTRFAAIKNAPR